MTSVAISVDEAFDQCESITRTEARNFYYGIRLLRPRKRAARQRVHRAQRRALARAQQPDAVVEIPGLRPRDRLTPLEGLVDAESDAGRVTGPPRAPAGDRL